ncbi:MAG: protein-glutamate O-methyltransferase CheR [Nitrospirota bacterium]|nr:protein-glutamate O-methyltransferase CheR [Nitrospirota bacterium]
MSRNLHEQEAVHGEEAPLALPAGYRLGRSGFNHLRKVIYDMSGIHLKDAKKQMVQSRLTKRLRILNIGSFNEYIDYLEENPEELTEMINRITTNKTYFFREPKHFEFLESRVLPECVTRQNRVGDARIINGWCAASSTGEEPYTLAMVVGAFLGNYPAWSARILASDLDTNVLARAVQGIYPKISKQDIPHRYSSPYVVKSPDGAPTIGFDDYIHSMLQFRQINLMAERYPIRSQLDFIFCRNVFIYFTRQDRDRVVRRMADLLRPGGYLFLGHSEVLDTDEFRGKLRFVTNTTYQKVGA